MGKAIELWANFDGDALCRLARASRDGNQTRRLLALAVISDGGSRTSAAKLGGVTLLIVRDLVMRFDAEGPGAPRNHWGGGAQDKLTEEHHVALAEMVERGPIPAIHRVVRWRLCDLAAELHERFGVPVEETTLGRALRKMGYRKISARPKHHAQNEYVIEDLKNLPSRAGKDPTAGRPRLSDRVVVAG